ncbi:MAG: hypothetical protein E6058_11295 [Cutibacterium avidum]|nr:hypothetical protein [Cutibacterium avidum]
MVSPAADHRVKFYGPLDLASTSTAGRAVAVIRGQLEQPTGDSLNDVLELHNALAFAEHGIFPIDLTQGEQDNLKVAACTLRGMIASYFSGLDASNLDDCLTGFDYLYAEDLLMLLGRHSVAEKVGGQTLFDALLGAGMPLQVMLSNKQFVSQHDRRLRDALLADPRI